MNWTPFYEFPLDGKSYSFRCVMAFLIPDSNPLKLKSLLLVMVSLCLVGLHPDVGLRMFGKNTKFELGMGTIVVKQPVG